MNDMVKLCKVQIPDVDKMFAEWDALSPKENDLNVFAELDKWAAQYEEYVALGFGISIGIISHDLFREMCEADRDRLQVIVQDVVSKNVKTFIGEWEAKNQPAD